MATLKNTTVNDTGFIQLPVGTTDQRPSAANGMMRYNSNTTFVEVYANNAWNNLALASEYETLTFLASGNLTVTNNGTTSVNIQKTSGSSSWDNHAYVADGFIAPVTMEFNKTASNTDDGQSYAMISWNADPTSSVSYSSLDYASYPYRRDNYSVYHNGSQVNFGGAWDPAAKFYLVYAANGYMYHYNGSTLLYSVNYGTGATVYVDSSFYSPYPNSAYTNIRVTKRAWNGSSYT